VADYKDFNVPTTFATGTAPAACGTVTTCRQRQNISKSRSEGGEPISRSVPFSNCS
jgi:hypothetical protein